MTSFIPLRVMQSLTWLSVVTSKLPKDVRRVSVNANGIPCEWIIPENGTQDKVLLYLHGGGFVFGLTGPHIQLTGYLAQKMQMRVLMVDYRVAPKHPFPAALDDCVTAYRWLLSEGYVSDNIVVAGDSAGGNLAITLSMKLRDNGDPLPAALGCMSPAADLSKRDAPPKDLVLPRRALKKYTGSYVGDTDPENPLISPLYGDWNGLPPMLIHAGELEVLSNDARRIEEIVRETDTEVTVKIFDGMFHVWQIYPDLDETWESLDEIAEFLKSK